MRQELALLVVPAAYSYEPPRAVAGGVRRRKGGRGDGGEYDESGHDDSKFLHSAAWPRVPDCLVPGDQAGRVTRPFGTGPQTRLQPSSLITQPSQVIPTYGRDDSFLPHVGMVNQTVRDIPEG
jgi:hypothetical protein